MKLASALVIACLTVLLSSVARAADAGSDAQHWQAGQIQVDGQWLDIAQAGMRLAADPKRIAYEKKRDALVDTADNHRELARWCQKQKLIDEARVHWLKVLEYAPEDAEAILALGLELHEGRLLTAAQIKAEKALAVARRQAWHKWRPIVAKWRAAVEGNSAEQLDAALRGLKDLDDPAALLVLEALFASDAKHDKADRLNLLLVETAGRSDSPEATDILLRRALRSAAEPVCQAACLELKKRPLHAYVPQLIAALPPEVQSQSKLQVLPSGAVVHEREIRVEGPQGAVSFQIESTVQPSDWLFAARIGPAVVARETARAAALENSVAQTEASLAGLRERVRYVLKYAAGFESAENPEEWLKQYAEHYGWAPPEERLPREYRLWTHESYYPLAPISDRERKRSETTANHLRTDEPAASRPPAIEVSGRVARQSDRPRMTSVECFAAGTPVQGLSGQLAIESIRPGDRVLSRDMQTGELAYKTVQQRTLRKSMAMVRVHFAKDSICVTPGHPFWVPARGWTVAKHLKAGDRVQGLSGEAIVERVAAQPPTEVYNLVVSDFSTYFVGHAGLLVHDDTGIAANPDAALPLAAQR